MMLVGRGLCAGRFLAAAGVLIVLLSGCSAPPGEEPPEAPTSVDPDSYASELVELTNETRAEEGLEELQASPCAREAALERATALKGEEKLVHAPLTPVIDACEPLTTAAENLVNSAAVPMDVVEAWLGSPGHRANIVDPDLTETGIGCVPDGQKMLCSQIFLGP
ncbi:Uncharacterized conserved protein YkwD, contains CAP (CSP/antigen 5/PR1) domain [Georgenia satyanarayanai]|uniref:Uncharacterized conserved protein YkwD, contains CAP (CSP/antigen 5/PR1) domain n=1 Tax=Georgenia satyanarayanai TaxID=860221 RepID=A0A2Y9AYS2_9MICO|nr:CAP domain-containing protein [Georgenia satyanarayanai]PYF95938.1 uncharacterized protein YkwD [Georgenia satyanarayanai]SSA47259.1 Uncharacterized conserved protein YkwD, contains CAP (CSP/antigen 5/PR1) domain [Georgenia satyanarayanai]